MRSKGLRLPGPVWLVVAAICVFTAVMWWADHVRVPTGQDAVRGVTVHAHTSTAPLVALATGVTWNTRPVYRLNNRSTKPMSHLQVFSWSNETLPILWVGATLPSNFSSFSSVVPPPVTLRPGQSAWFELGEAPPQTITVLWTVDSTAVYETIRIAQ